MSRLISNVTIGADIEVFLQDRETAEIVTAEGIIRGTKENPFRFREGNPFFATSLDNVMAEFCIPPAKTGIEFHSSIREAIDYIESVIPRNLKTLALPSARIDGKYLLTENALLFGCDPDYNAWLLGEMNVKPNATVIPNLRSCGGHIHIGYNNPDENITMALIRAMDIFIGLPSILQEPDNERKSLYGKAGAFRFKDYGGEYRTVSNYYINDKKTTEWAFDNTMEAIEFVNMEAPMDMKTAEAIQAAINFNNKELAQTLCTYFGVKLAA
jgi:hypothetical protein